MADLMIPDVANKQTLLLSKRLDLSLDQMHLDITEFQARDASDLKMVLKNLEVDLPIGKKTISPDGLLIRQWPDRFWAVGEASTMSVPNNLRQVAIGHGYTVFRLRGQNALQFLAQYSSADLFEPSIMLSQILRTRIGAYNALLWWSAVTDVFVVLERSLTQSFPDYLTPLIIRNTEVLCSTKNRSDIQY